MKLSRLLLGVALLLASAAGRADGTNYTWTGGANNEQWKNSQNWNPNTGWPGQDPADTATVPRVDAEYPEVPLGRIEIASLTVTFDQNGGGRVDFEPHDSQRAFLEVTDRDGLVVGQTCTMTLERGSALVLSGGGEYRLDGVIDANGSGLNIEPLISFAGDDMTHVLTGTGSIRGSHPLLLLYGDLDNVLVLGRNNALYGSVKVAIALVNHGIVDATIPADETGGHTLRLFCQPKVGDGDWKVSGDAGLANPDVLVVDTPLAGTGNLVLGEYGQLEVNVHTSLYGTFTMARNAKVTVQPEVMFDVDRFAKEGCPE